MAVDATRPDRRAAAPGRFAAAFRELKERWPACLPPGAQGAPHAEYAAVVLNRLLYRWMVERWEARHGRGSSHRRCELEIPQPLFRETVALFERHADEVGPAALGILCEGESGRKQLGAFYTPPDVAAYVADQVIAGRVLDLLPPGCCRIEPRPDAGFAAGTYAHRQHQRFLTERSAAIHGGQVRDTEQATTWNLDLRQLALHRIEGLDDPEVLLRLYRELLPGITVLDLTCGSGAFLTAALDLLAALYRACLRRLCRLACDTRPDDELLQAVEEVREPSRQASAACRAALQQLYGVDLMPAAAEACRLRLALEVLHRCDGLSPGKDPLALLERRVCVGDAIGAEAWEPNGAEPEGFAWRRAFPEVRAPGGFDIVLGNPPYGPARQTAGPPGFRTRACGNQYAWFVERALELLHPGGRLGMVVPISVVSGESYQPLRELLERRTCWISTYSNRPAKLFPGVEQRLAIVLTRPSAAPVTYMSAYQHWDERERPHLFHRLRYVRASRWERTGVPVKSGSPAAEAVFARVSAHRGRLGELVAPGPEAVWLHDGPTYWVRALPFPPNAGREPAGAGHYHRLPVASREAARLLAAILSSSTFYAYFKMVSNCRDLGRKEWSAFPLDPLPAEHREQLAELGEELERRLRETASRRERVYPSGRVGYEEYYPWKARQVLDWIDRVLAAHYGFSAEELEYVLQHDAAYRMGCVDE